MRIHDPATLICGDVWELRGILIDAAGDPLDITSFAIEWRLRDPLHNIVLNENDVSIVKTDPTAGKLTITISAAITRELEPAHYYDALRISNGVMGPTTMWSGSIFAEPNFMTINPLFAATESSDEASMTGTVA